MRLVGFLVGLVFALQLALFGFLVFALASHQPSTREQIPVLGFSLMFVGWVIGPVFGFGMDETLDPERLSLLPLSRRRLMTGLTVASTVGVGPVATLVALSGAMGYAAFGWGSFVVAAAILLEFVLCLTAARAVTTGLTRAMRSRKARDIWAVLFSLMAVAAALLPQLARVIAYSSGGRAATRVEHVLRWLPPGMAGRAAVEADAGRLGLAALYLVPVALAIVLGVLWWRANLDRLTSTSEPAGQSSDQSTVRPMAGGVGRLRNLLPAGRTGAVALKDVKYLWRDPILRAQRFMTGLAALGGLMAVAFARNLHRPEMVLASSVFVWWTALPAANQFAVDRGAYWMNAVAAGDSLHDVLGKNLAGFIINGPPFLLLAVAVAAITGGWVYLPVALALGIGVLGSVYGLGNVTSVRLAQPLPESMTNLWSARAGQGCGTGLVLALVLLANQVLMVPLAGLVLAGLLEWRPLLWATIPVAIAYGVVLYAAGVRVATGWLRTHQADLLEALSPKHVA